MGKGRSFSPLFFLFQPFEDRIQNSVDKIFGVLVRIFFCQLYCLIYAYGGGDVVKEQKFADPHSQ